MKINTPCIPRIALSHEGTALNSYLLRIVEIEHRRRRKRRHAYSRISPFDCDSADVVGQLLEQWPTPHLDAAEE
jgi:hypothetical protein